MKAINLLAGVLLGLLAMFFMRPHLWPLKPQVIIKKEIVYKTRWKVKKEITYQQAKNCVFSPITIEGKADQNKLLVTAKDDCKESKKEFNIECEDGSWTGEIVAGAAGAVLGVLLGVSITK